MELNSKCHVEGCLNRWDYAWQPDRNRHAIMLCGDHYSTMRLDSLKGHNMRTCEKDIPRDVDDLVEYADCQGLTDDDAMYLDEAVHDVCWSESASEINNAGLARQVEYLLAAHGPIGAQQAIDNAVREKEILAKLGM